MTTTKIRSFHPNGYQETIKKGLSAIHSFNSGMSLGKDDDTEQLDRLKEEIKTADAIVIGAGAGLSTSAGFTYSGERFKKWFSDFEEKYGFQDMYSGGFYPYKTKEEFWAYWSRYIYINRYLDAPKDTYTKLYNLVKDGNGIFAMPSGGGVRMEIDSSLIPKCPIDGSDVTMNLRSDDTFLEDGGWHRASAAYSDFLRRHENLHVLFLELGVGSNTPVIIKYPFWQMTMENEKATYACLNYKEAYCPREIEDRSVCINSDIDELLDKLA